MFGPDDVEFEVTCTKCGCSLDVTERTYYDAHWPTFELKIEPCPDCVDEARSLGYDDGLEEGRDVR